LKKRNDIPRREKRREANGPRKGNYVRSEKKKDRNVRARPSHKGGGGPIRPASKTTLLEGGEKENSSKVKAGPQKADLKKVGFLGRREGEGGGNTSTRNSYPGTGLGNELVEGEENTETREGKGTFP